MKLSCLTAIVFFLSATGCASISRYDDHTYKSVTSLKGEVKVFMDDCAAKGASGEKAVALIEGFRVKLSQAYEYEVGKTKNSETISQMKILAGLFDESYTRFAGNKIDGAVCISRKDGEASDLTTGCLSKAYCGGKSKVMERAFDIAISTEGLKNK